MIDMESVGYVEPTLRVFREAHARYPKVGIALQSYLRRTERDVEACPPGCRIRLVKGAYLEPPGGRVHDASGRWTRATRACSRRCSPAGTRSTSRRTIPASSKACDGVWTRPARAGLGWSSRCCTVSAATCRARFAGQGYPVRVYIPYGTEWYPYLTRRLAERPANVWFFLSNLLRAR